jgi:hypothetical protein
MRCSHQKKESDIVFLGHGLCGFGGSIYKKVTSHSTLSVCITMIDPTTGWFEIVEAKNKSAITFYNLF